MQSDHFPKIFFISMVFFSDFPIADYEISGIYFDPSAKESLVFIESFSDNIDQSISIEKNQDQSNNPEWAICEKIDLLLQRISNGFIHCEEIKQNWKKKFLLVKRRLSKLQQWNAVQNMNQMLLKYILIPTQ